MDNSFLGRNVVITGACGGLGQAMARIFHEKQARLILLDKHTGELEKLAGELGSDTRTITYDQSDAASIEEAIARIGKADVLVNNAAYMVRKPLLEMSAAEVHDLINVDLTGMIVVAMETAKLMRGQGGGVIVNVASQLAFTSEPNRAVYSTAKAGLIRFTKSAAREWIELGIRVVGVAPGVVQTNMTDNLSPEAKAKLLSRVPRGEMIMPEEIGRMIAFLASAEGSAIVGQTLIADKGYLIH